MAVWRDGETRASRVEAMARGQAERIAPMAREIMAEAGLDFAALQRVVVTTGPGSFTGVRVGLSFARGLALALKIPCLGVPSLEALALQHGEEGLRAAIVATPGASYAALYQDGAALIAPAPMEAETIQARLRAASGARDFNLVGPGVAPDPIALAARGARLDPASYPPAPLYLRGAGASLPKSPA